MFGAEFAKHAVSFLRLWFAHEGQHEYPTRQVISADPLSPAPPCCERLDEPADSLVAGPPVSNGEWTARSGGGPSIRTRVEPEGHRKPPPSVPEAPRRKMWGFSLPRADGRWNDPRQLLDVICRYRCVEATMSADI